MSCGCGVLVMMIVVYSITVKAGLLGGHYHHQLRTTPQELNKMKALGIPVKAIRVLRNPYDIIATRILYKTLGRRGVLLAKNKSDYKHPTTQML